MKRSSSRDLAAPRRELEVPALRFSAQDSHCRTEEGERPFPGTRQRNRGGPLITPALFSHRPPPDREKRENSQEQCRLFGRSPLSRSGGGRWERGVGGVRGPGEVGRRSRCRVWRVGPLREG